MRMLTAGLLTRGFIAAAPPGWSRRRRLAGRAAPAARRPPAGRCPAATRSGSGRRCRRSPPCRPALTSQTMRRATRPAIWTATTSCPSGVRISTLLRSLSWLAAASSADLYSPGRCTTATTSPLIGMRWTWASKIDRKMLTRGSGRSGRLSSAGGTASSTRQISPSAGATTTPGRVGGTRGGWRKNAALAPAASRPARRSHRLRRPAAATARPAPTNGRPAGCIGGIVVLARATSRAGPDLRSGRLAIVSRFYGWLPVWTGPIPAQRIPPPVRRRPRRSPADSSPTPASADDATRAARSW